MSSFEHGLSRTSYSDLLVCHRPRRHAVRLTRTVDLFYEGQKKNFERIEASTRSIAAEASSTLQASLREHSKLCHRRTQSYAANAKFHRERAQAYLNLGTLALKFQTRSSTLQVYPKVKIRSSTLAMNLRARSQRKWCTLLRTGMLACVCMERLTLHTHM